MAEIVIEIPEDLKSKMSELKIDWSVLVASFICDRLVEWARLRAIVDKSKLSEDDALKLGSEINKGLAKRYKQLSASE